SSRAQAQYAMAPSPCRPAIANMTEIAPVLDRRSSFELAGAKTVLGNIPGGAAILGRHEISALEDRHRTIDRALAPTGHTGQRRAMLATRPARKACHAPAPERRPYHSRHSPQAAATTAGTRSARGENLAPDYRVLTG